MRLLIQLSHILIFISVTTEIFHQLKFPKHLRIHTVLHTYGKHIANWYRKRFSQQKRKDNWLLLEMQLTSYGFRIFLLHATHEQLT